MIKSKKMTGGSWFDLFDWGKKVTGFIEEDEYDKRVAHRFMEDAQANVNLRSKSSSKSPGASAAQGRPSSRSKSPGASARGRPRSKTPGPASSRGRPKSKSPTTPRRQKQQNANNKQLLNRLRRAAAMNKKAIEAQQKMNDIATYVKRIASLKRKLKNSLTYSIRSQIEADIKMLEERLRKLKGR